MIWVNFIQMIAEEPKYSSKEINCSKNFKCYKELC